MNQTIAERRGTKRHNLRTPLHLLISVTEAGQKFKAKCLDISERGALLEADVLLQPGSAVSVQLKLSESITGQRHAKWNCRGRIVHVLPQASQNAPFQMGMHFDWVEGSGFDSPDEFPDYPYLR